MKSQTLVIIHVLLIVQSTSASPTALLLAPHSSNDYQFKEFWNDTVLMYDALRSTGRYTDDSIHVYYGNGQNITSVSPNPRYASRGSIIDGAATVDGINSAFSMLSNTVGSNDHLMVWTFDHGGLFSGTPKETVNAQSGDTFLVTQEYRRYTDNTFAARMNQIGYGSSSVFMQQCYSGGFINELKEIENTLIMTAAGGDAVAYRGSYYDSTYYDTHGEFNRLLYSGLTGLNPDGSVYGNSDLNGDGSVSMDETWATISGGMTTSIPQYSDTWNMGRYSLYGAMTGEGGDITSVPAPGALILSCLGIGVLGKIHQRKHIL